jgi:hypothetical protein
VNDTSKKALHIDVVSGPTDHGTVNDYELFYARRALRRLKTRLGRQGLLDLLANDIEKGNAFIRQAAENSNGEFRPATTVLAVTGLTAGEFMSWLDAKTSDEAAMLAAQPEHFAMDGRPDGTVLLVENFGPHVCSCTVAFGRDVEWAAGAAEFLPDDQYPVKKISTLELDDGTLIGRVLSQFGDTDDGFSASMSIYFPAACPEELIEHHRRHLAVEFTNWITAAAAARPNATDNKE